MGTTVRWSQLSFVVTAAANASATNGSAHHAYRTPAIVGRRRVLGPERAPKISGLGRPGEVGHELAREELGRRMTLVALTANCIVLRSQAARAAPDSDCVCARGYANR